MSEEPYTLACPICSGIGYVHGQVHTFGKGWDTSPCHTCQGFGQVASDKLLVIPRGQPTRPVGSVQSRGFPFHVRLHRLYNRWNSNWYELVWINRLRKANYMTLALATSIAPLIDYASDLESNQALHPDTMLFRSR